MPDRIELTTDGDRLITLPDGRVVTETRRDRDRAVAGLDELIAITQETRATIVAIDEEADYGR